MKLDRSCGDSGRRRSRCCTDARRRRETNLDAICQRQSPARVPPHTAPSLSVCVCGSGSSVVRRDHHHSVNPHSPSPLPIAVHTSTYANSLPKVKGKGSPYSIAENPTVPELIPVLGSQPAGDVSHKPGGRLPLLSARRAVNLANLNKAATNFSAW